MIDYKDFGMRVRELRRKHGLTQEELAEQAGISTSFMGHIERGSRVASLETLVLLCNALKASPEYFLEASLEDDIARHMPAEFTPEKRAKLSSFFHMAEDLVSNWGD